MNVTLPKNERREVPDLHRHKLWIYGAPFSGKTTLADHFPHPLMLNTDGNSKYVTAPAELITDRVEVNGRLTETTLAWEVFKAYVDELAKRQNDFETIVVDLVEDMYEHCRQYIYREMGITHESDDSFRAWDKVRTEFLTVMKRLMNLDYENIILISQEDISRDITKRTGDKITAIKPNIQARTALKLAGMVDVVIRAVAQDDDYRLTFKSDEVVFGGGRIKLSVKEIPNDYDALMKVLEAETPTGAPTEEPKPKRAPRVTKPVEEPKQEEPKTETVASVEDVPVPEEPKTETSAQEEPKTEAAPPRRTRRTRREEA